MADVQSDVTSEKLHGQGNFIQEALADAEVRKSVRARLVSEGRLPHFSREEMARIVKKALAEEPAKAVEKEHGRNGAQNGTHKNGTHKG